MSAIPGPNETLLLRAATLDGDDALDAWRRWRSGTDFEQLEGESNRIIPLLYRNLTRLGVPARETTRYASVYRHNWAANRLAFTAGAGALRLLHAEGIPTLLLKGAALSLLHYRDVGVRSMGDVDVLVPPARAEDVSRVLEAAGWKNKFAAADGSIDPASWRVNHSVDFLDHSGRSLDLHWYATADARAPGADDPFWRFAVPVDFEGQATLALSPTDLLYNVLAHGYASVAPHIRWAADAAVIIRGGGVDWWRFVELAKARRLVLPIHQALSWLARELAVPVPESALTALAAAPVPWIDRLEHRNQLSEDPFTPSRVAVRLWCWYRRSTNATGVELALGFPSWLASYSRLERPWRDPRTTFKRVVAKLRA